MSKLDAVAITLKDTRVVKFGKGEKIRKEILWTPEGIPHAIRFDGRNGETLTVPVVAFPAAVQQQATAHGFSQKIGDEYADMDAVDDCWETLLEIVQRLIGGAWKGDRAGFAGISILLKACMKAFPEKTEADVRGILKGLKPEEKTALKNSEKVKPFVEEIERERAKTVDVDATLAKFV